MTKSTSDAEEVGHEALRPNPALDGLAFLLGTWRTEGIHPDVPGKTFHGRTSFEPGFGGAFVVMRSEIDEEEVPSGIAILASDDGAGEWWMSYFDERGTSRRYVVTVLPNEIRYERLQGHFSQMFVIRAQPGQQTLVSTGRMREGDGPWRDDLSLTYRRVEHD